MRPKILTMKPAMFAILVLIILGAMSCSRGQTVVCSDGPTRTSKPQSATVMEKSPVLFLETDEIGAVPVGPQIVRYRFVKINSDLLHDIKQKDLGKKEIIVNLFPDVVYTVEIERVEFDGASYSWSGHMKGETFGNLNMVYTAGVFIAHFASTKGIYEVSAVGGKDLYRVVQIDQQRLPPD
jgi:hypothetical protein